MTVGRARWVTYWGALGFVALVSQAIVRLAPLAIEAIEMGMAPFEWAAMIACLLVMGYAEGYKGFHLQAAPRVVARGLYFDDHRSIVRIIFAPLFCMGLFHATRKRLVLSWSLLVMIVTLIILVRHLAQPWRGIVDAGVVLGLVMGVASTLFYLFLAARGRMAPFDPEVPVRHAGARTVATP